MSTDQPNPITVHVTQEMIDAGIPKTCISCPIQLAMRQIMDRDFFCEVNKVAVSVFNNACELQAEIHLPVTARNFIHRFDNGEPVEPFSFTLPRDAFLHGMLREGV